MVFKFDAEQAGKMELGPFRDKTGTHTPGQKDAVHDFIGNANGTLRLGVWECTPGRFASQRATTEFFVVLKGSATLIGADGTRTDVGPGDHAVTPKGWKGEWIVHATIRKIFMIHPEAP
jgi:uncharacterized cupin superfamily protein